jgi:hypothetical protein
MIEHKQSHMGRSGHITRVLGKNPIDHLHVAFMLKPLENELLKSPNTVL